MVSHSWEENFAKHVSEMEFAFRIQEQLLQLSRNAATTGQSPRTAGPVVGQPPWGAPCPTAASRVHTRSHSELQPPHESTRASDKAPCCPERGAPVLLEGL